ncbi:phosphotransferase family protein [Streptomyces fumanus]|uniref:phosphotransferase family protein n=1 Tax=Streptomyces fumanus TaxID=67302 RepID=UPI00167E819B|nr:aminoglycoside phosphotransferase family protein [Streptomyces fumanus]
MTRPPALVSYACSALLGASVRTGERLSSGSRTAVFRAGLRDDRSVIVKLYDHTARRNALTEAAAIRAAGAAVPVPRVLGSGVISEEGATALITRDLGGRTLGAFVRSGHIPHAQAVQDLGHLLRRLHGAPVEHVVPRRPFFDSVSSLVSHCPPDLLSRIGPALAIISGTPNRAPSVWCHGDIHFDNVVLSDPHGTRYLVDFTDAAPGRREADVAHALVMTAAHTPWDRRTLIDAYRHPLDESRLSAWVVLHTVRCWMHATPGASRSLWSDRLDDLARQTPHLFRTPRRERTPR